MLEVVQARINEYIECLEEEKRILEQKDTGLLDAVLAKKQSIIYALEEVKAEVKNPAVFFEAMQPLREHLGLQEENIMLLERAMEETRLELTSVDHQVKRLMAYKKMTESS